MPEQNFYDIHFHAMNLAHPNILSFVSRIKWRMLLLASPLAPLAVFLAKDKINNVQNLLSVMENDIGGFFMLVEYFLCREGPVKNDSLVVGGSKYRKIIITPLLMDFGYKNMQGETFYNIPPQKPIVAQVEDVFTGIANYCAGEISKTAENGATRYNVEPRLSENVFEIYPFLGLNTVNYDLPRLEKMMTKYFADYRGRYEDFKAAHGKFVGDIESLRSNVFAGVKLYPPIGFDPWPDEAEERKKVEFLYEFCCAKEIPVTVHCSDGGFDLDDNAPLLTCPDRWSLVLRQKRYETLKLNFAHFGKQTKKKFLLFSQDAWRSRILELMKVCPNVYADFSYLGMDEKSYEMLSRLCNANPFLCERLLFGSDFMINLLDLESYNHYLELFAATEYFAGEQKAAFCRINPEKFLWRR